MYLSESNELEIVITTATGGSGDIATGYDDDRAMFLLRYDGTQAIRNASYTHTHTHRFNDPLSGTTRVSRYQKVKPI